jgi:hypothetical protein
MWRFDSSTSSHSLIYVDEGRLTASREEQTGESFMSVRTTHAFRKGSDGINVFFFMFLLVGSVCVTRVFWYCVSLFCFFRIFIFFFFFAVFVLEIVKLGELLAVGVGDLSVPLVGRCLGFPKSDGKNVFINKK